MAREKKKTEGRTFLFWVFWAAVLYAGIAPQVISFYGGSAGASWLATWCGPFVAFMAKFDDLAEFSLGPLRAKMRKTIDEANATLGQLREVATSMVTATLTDVMAGDFLGGMTRAKRLELHDKLMDQLQALGVSDEQRERADADWHKGICTIYCRIISNTATKHAKSFMKIAKYNKISNEFNTMIKWATWDAAIPAQLKALCQTHDLLTSEVSQWLEDYQNYLETGEIRRKDEFALD
jgi:hypothetical protein